jgi:D-alanine-D-alanine ligase
VLGAAYDVRPDALVALPPVEIVPHAGRFFDYAEKYSAGGADERCPPELLPPATCARREALARAAHRALGCDGASRTDFIVPRAASAAPDAFGEPVALETNTLPGLTERSLLPRAAAAAGLDYRSLCVALCLMALAAHDRRNGEETP